MGGESETVRPVSELLMIMVLVKKGRLKLLLKKIVGQGRVDPRMEEEEVVEEEEEEKALNIDVAILTC